MRSAQSRLGVVTSLASARRGVVRCVDALPVPPSALKVGGAALAGLAGVALVRGFFSSRRKKAAPATPAAAATPQRSLGFLFSETALALLLPLLRRYLLGETPAGLLSAAKLTNRTPGAGL